MSEHLQLETKTGKVRGTTSNTGTLVKPIDFSEVFVVGLDINTSLSGSTQLVSGQSYIDVVFGTTQTTVDWLLAECEIVNELDAEPLNIAPGIITSKTTTGFRLQLSGSPDSDNYFLHWGIGEIGPGGVGVTDFLSLIDTPNSYDGQAGKAIKVNADATALEFGIVHGTGGNDSFVLHGVTHLIDGQNYIDVVLPATQPDGNWIFSGSIVNVLDGSPLNIWPGIMSVKSATGFRLQLSGAPDSSNYSLHWGIGRKELTPGGGEEGVVLATDDFDRADDVTLGADWTDIDDGGLAIASNAAIGTLSGTGISGSYRTAETFVPDQFSEILITGVPTNAVGLLLRAGPGNVDYYGQYYWNSGAPFLQLYLRRPGDPSYLVLGSPFSCGILAPGTRLRLMMVGNALAFMVDGVEKVSWYDQATPGASPPWITAGAPGIAISGNTDTVEDWSGGTAGFEVHYLSTDSHGVESYHLISNKNGYGIHTLKVLRPTTPVGGLAHHFLYALPVAPEDDTTYGDGMETLRLMNAHNLYNVTIIQPSFAFFPWYPDHASDPNFRYESFMTLELQPWVKANLGTSGTEQNWLLGFSKSGFGALTMMFRNPTLFDLVGIWDFPVSTLIHYNSLGEQMAENYATDLNFQDNYRITDAFLDTWKAPFLTENRIHMSGYNFWNTDIVAFDTKLTSKSILHTYPTPVAAPEHSWNGGWVPATVEGLYQLSLLL